MPINEVQRIASLHSFHVLDSAAETAFNELAELASQICGTPIGLISLVDSSRQWFKASVGLDVLETPRSVAFCAHAIHKPNEVMEVPDALVDSRFAENPLVTGEPGIRFYAGAPLVTADGNALGTLCVVDRRKRALTEMQRTALQVLAKQVVAQLELRKKVILARESVDDLLNLKDFDIDQRNAMLTASIDLKAFIGLDYVYRFVNKTYLDYWQKESHEIVGLSVLELVGVASFDRLKPRLDRCLSGEIVTYDSEFDFPGKGRRSINVSYFPARDRKNAIIGIVVRVHDVEDLRRTEKTLQATVKKLLEFTDSQQQFIYALSHDLREPLNTIINFSTALKEDFTDELSPTAQKFLEFISSGTGRMRNLLDELIQYVKLDKIEPSMDDCDLNEVVDHVLSDLSDIIKRNHSNIHALSLPMIKARASSIHLLLQNLITNATKFHRHGVPPQIEIQCKSLEDEWEISVKDNGIGIDETYLASLFQPFRRLNSPREYAGTGLGLAMVKRIAEMHGGRVWITSTKGVGSEFFVTIAKNPRRDMDGNANRAMSYRAEYEAIS